jgi:hypothetical protein
MRLLLVCLLALACKTRRTVCGLLKNTAAEMVYFKEKVRNTFIVESITANLSIVRDELMKRGWRELTPASDSLLKIQNARFKWTWFVFRFAQAVHTLMRQVKRSSRCWHTSIRQSLQQLRASRRQRQLARQLASPACSWHRRCVCIHAARIRHEQC